MLDIWSEERQLREDSQNRVETGMMALHASVETLRGTNDRIVRVNCELRAEIARLWAVVSSLQARSSTLETRVGELEDRRTDDEGPIVMFSVLHHLVQRSKGKQPHYRPVVGDHPDKERLRKAVSGADVRLANLIGQSPFAAVYFTGPLVEIFLGSFSVNNRHVAAHLEYDQAQLLRKLLALELSRRQAWQGEPSKCPETIALRLYLTSLEPAAAKALVDRIKANADGQFEPLKESELAAIAFLIEVL